MSRTPGLATASLRQVSVDESAYGARMYRGLVFPLHGGQEKPLYVYERRVQDAGDGQRSTSFTRDGDSVALIETALHGPGSSLREYTQHHFQTNQVGRVWVEGHQVHFSLTDDEGERRASEALSLPVVVGPTLFSFVFEQVEALRHGGVVPFRFAVPSRLETVGFQLKCVAPCQEPMRVEMSASSGLIGLIVDPLYITLGAGQLSRLEGRVPTKRKVNGAWVDFDARVEYESVEQPYR